MDKMQNEFEVWFSQFENQSEIQRRAAWSAWKASRAALCVELPDNLDGEYYADGWNACLMAVGDKIEGAGVSYK